MMKSVSLKYEFKQTLVGMVVFAGVLGAAVPVHAGGVVMFNEIQFNPANDAQELEFVEIYNTLCFDLDISLWELDGGIEYTFPVGTTIPGEGWLVIAKSPSALEAAAGISGVLGPYTGQLGNGGESIRIENNSSRVMDEVDYGDGGRWPVAPDGSGASLAKIDAFTASDAAANWHPGRVGGTPGWDNFGSSGGTTVQTTLVSKTADWKYRDYGTDPGTNWMQPSFGDTNWASGPSPLGYTDPWITTPVSYGPDSGNKYPTTYFRYHFNVADPSVFSSVQFSTMMDDGAILYLNGTEFARVRMDAGTITYLNYANDAVSQGEENLYEPIALSASLLQLGTNVLAVEVHQQSGGSSDLAFSAELIGLETLLPPDSDADLLDDPQLVINEIAGVTNTSWWIELRNNSGSALDPAGYIVSVDGDPTRRYTLPSSSMIPGGFLLVKAAQLGFTAIDEESIFLYRPGEESVADARVAKRSLRGRTDEQWRVPSASTPGGTNSFSFNNDIVINEIMYHHQATNSSSTYVESNEEWIELYNRGTGTVDLSGWKFDDGISYEFPVGTSLAPGGYLVVSLFSGTLANGGERLRLVDSVGNPADEVHYFDGKPWPEWPDGKGSSLELRDPFADNSRPEAWAASAEGPQSSWQTYSYQLVASASLADGPDTQWNDFVMGLLDAGEVLLDDISVIEDPGGADTELISTGDFEGGVGDWRLIGTHRHWEVITDPDNAANNVLRIRATGAADHMHNHAEITLDNGQSVENGKTYRISFRAKWIGGSRLLNTRLYFNRVPRTYVLAASMNNGTPGSQNTANQGNIGPTFEDMIHDPAVPDASEPVTVSIDANDPHGVNSVVVWYSINGGTWQQTAMTDTGEGHYNATLPGGSASSIVQFYVEAEDGLGATSTFPADGPEAGALYQVNDGLSDAFLHNFRIIMTQSNADWMDNNTNYLSNDQIPSTVIFREQDIYYDVGVRFKGSLYGRHAAAKAGFRAGFNTDKPFNGVLDNVSVDRSALTTMSRMPETLLHMAMNRAGGVMTKYADMIKVMVPISGHSNPAQLQLGHYSDVFLDGQFENGGDGDLFEFEYIYYPNSANAQGYKEYNGGSADIRPSIDDYGNDKESYRHSWGIKNNRARDDYSGMIEFAKVMGMTGSAFNSQINSVADVDQWLRYLAYGGAASLNDNFARGSEHNAYFYRRPSDGRFLYFTHDLDHTMASPTLVSGNSYLQKMIAADPKWERLYYAHMRDILETAWNPTYMQTYTDQFKTLVPSGDFSGFLSHIANCYNTISSQLASGVAPAYPFAVTSGAQTVNTLSTTVSGNGWLDVYEVYLDGQDVPLELTWTSSGSGSSKTYSWSATVPLDPGTNALTILAYDYHGNPVGSNTVAITTTATGDPLQDHLRITELMVNPASGSDYEFLELCNTGSQPLDLSGVYFSEGIGFDFSAAGFTNLNPGEYCVLVANPAAFTSRYDTAGIVVAGQYSGKLANEGETIEILGALNEELLRFTYDSGRGWPLAAAGAGHALVPLDSAIAGEAAGSLYYGGNWRAGNWIGGSPGQVETLVVPAVQLNEIIAHTDYNNPAYLDYDSNDNIELYNAFNTNVVLATNWYLSDDASQLDKWAIPTGNTILANGTVAFDEVTGFHSPITNGFGLDKAGEQVFLSYLPLAGSQQVVDAVRFKGQENGVALGRYSDGESFWYSLTPTVDSTNAKPDLHPVISEFMFHPPDNPTNNTLDEYIEIHNPTAGPVDLWNASGTWRIDGGVGYSFPTNTTLAAGESLVLVTFNPANNALLTGFLATYGLTNGEVTIMGPMSDQLDNRGERIALERPQAGDLPGEPVSWAIVDEVIYFHGTPWPTGADGTGRSLQRKHTRWSGNDPSSWYASFAPSPGKRIETYGTHGVPDWWLAETIPGATNDFSLAASGDPDGDGLTTEEEYVAGTAALIFGSRLQMEAAAGKISFQTIKAGYEYNGLERWYSLKVSARLNSGVFTPVAGFTDVPGDGGTIIVPIPADGPSAAFYQLETELR